MKPVELIVGALIGFCVTGFVVGGGGTAAAWLYLEHQRESIQGGWTLQPITVARRKLSPGESITHEDLERRDVPEQLVTASFVTPAYADYLVGLPIQVELEPGAPLRWSYFPVLEDPVNDRALVRACTAELREVNP